MFKKYFVIFIKYYENLTFAYGIKNIFVKSAYISPLIIKFIIVLYKLIFFEINLLTLPKICCIINKHYECGGIAQLARVLGSYPIGRWFKSYCRYHMARWSRG